MWWWILPGMLLLAYIILVLWYRWAWQRLRMAPEPPADWQPATRVTVLVPARNESGHIEACLQALAAQQYPGALLEILVLDDASEDDTANRVDAWSARDPRIRCLRLGAATGSQSHKKKAIEKGIAAASGDLIVCTDADCTMGTQWLRSLVYGYEKEGWQFIAAPVEYHTEPTFLSVFQTLDFMTLQGISGASVSQRFHTMCNGANIAYSKKAFEEVQGFAGIDALPTGDDMLLMYKIYRRYPQGVVWLKSKAAVVRTAACASWRAFFQQRIRWASKAAYFDDRRMFYVLLLVYLLNLVLFLLVLAGFFNAVLWWPAILLLLGKTAVEAWFLLPVARFFGQERWLVWFPLLQLPHVVYTVVAGWLGRFGSYEWKGRRISKPSGLVKRDV
ncbi:MAG: glycosyltransferase [Chitinophagaceae bacterium]|nr:glycosyltransferase [Chitinophagaceae bacterium]